MELFNNKRAAQNNIGIIILVVIGFLLWQGGAFRSMATVSGNGGVTPTTPVTLTVQGGCNVEDTTVTFNHVDLYSQATAVTQGARALLFDNDINVQIANGGSKTYSPNDVYKVLSGNLTTTLTAGTDYYPQYQEGNLACSGTITIQGKLAKTTSQANLAFTWWNNNDAANTAQTIGANTEKTVRIRFASPDNGCFGNPYAAERGGKNVMCFTFPTDAVSSVELIGADLATRPKSAAAVVGNDTLCYKWDVICDNGEYNGKVLIKSSSTDPTGGNNISISVHDVTFDYNAETLALITGVEDEVKTRNDIGMTDFSTGADWDYSISLA